MFNSEYLHAQISILVHSEMFQNTLGNLMFNFQNLMNVMDYRANLWLLEKSEGACPLQAPPPQNDAYDIIRDWQVEQDDQAELYMVTYKRIIPYSTCTGVLTGLYPQCCNSTTGVLPTEQYRYILSWPPLIYVIGIQVFIVP